MRNQDEAYFWATSLGSEPNGRTIGSTSETSMARQQQQLTKHANRHKEPKPTEKNEGNRNEANDFTVWDGATPAPASSTSLSYGLEDALVVARDAISPPSVRGDFLFNRRRSPTLLSVKSCICTELKYTYRMTPRRLAVLQLWQSSCGSLTCCPWTSSLFRPSSGLLEDIDQAAQRAY